MIKNIAWSEAISVNNKKIDDQHKHLIELTNNLIDHSNEKADSALISESLDELVKYTRTHFRDEEQLLEACNYPKLNDHKEEHELFILKVSNFCMDVMDKKATVTQEIITFLVEWLLNHTSKDDLDYKHYLA